MKNLYQQLTNSKPVSELVEKLRAGERSIQVTGLAGALSRFFAAVVHERTGSSMLLVTAGPTQAERALDDLVSILGHDCVGNLPPLHRYPYHGRASAIGPRNERTEALMRISSGVSTVVVTQPEVLLEHGPDRKWIEEHQIYLKAGEDYSRDTLLAGISDAGYKRESLIDSQGQFAVRGGLVDVFSYGNRMPIRIEFDDETISSLRWFDPVTQRSVKPVEEVVFLIGEEADCNGRGLMSLLPEDMVIFWENLEEIEDRIELFKQRFDETKAKSSEGWKDGTNLTLRSLSDVLSETERFRQMKWFGPMTSGRSDMDFNAKHPDPVPPGLDNILRTLTGYLDRGLQLWIAADTEGEKDRLEELLAESEFDQVRVFTSSLSGGFVSTELQTALLTTHELFNRRRLRSRFTRFRRRSVQFDRTSLRRGDLVVHTEYGIGLYEGLQTVKVRGQPRDCLRIKYQDDVKLYVRVENFGLVEKYAGSESARPRLSKLGGSEWIRTKKRTRKALKDISAELIKLYAERKVTPGHAYPHDTHWQSEMEASFEFEDTPDQITSTVEMKRDLEAPHPMDRLLCGDVGFGKTEIAVRAAFKVVQESRQVAVLVPTTILAQQHLDTFRSRLSAYPVSVEVLSRFRSAKEMREVIRGMKDGSVDIVIGTHRLLSRDVGFLRLGLLIIDEEHRFGVRHKEKLKQLKTNVDVLTLTATPIPRTLHLALMGARDTSLINTPPMDRLPVQTEVHGWSEDLIKESVLREVDRHGQVFFVHNRVQSINSVRNMIERLVPGLRYAVAHGQMPEKELEKVVSDFLRYRYDVLVTTMIIESGIDMPNVNTLIVNRADRFGLAQLYQLRGRIGRSNRQAYAYLMTPPRLVMTVDARRRLATISELTELGSGMKVAMRDLEIRGAGNLLGAQQSGYINAVGFDLYSRMLEEEVGRLKEKAEQKPPPVEEEIHVEYDGPALFTGDYIDDVDLRYDFYRRLSSFTEIEEVDQLLEELTDRFGLPPRQARNLIELTRLKILCRTADISKLYVNREYLIASLNLPSDPTESQRAVGRLVAAADPEQVEFRLSEPVELIYRFNSGERLQKARKFLQRITRQGILQD